MRSVKLYWSTSPNITGPQSPSRRCRAQWSAPPSREPAPPALAARLKFVDAGAELPGDVALRGGRRFDSSEQCTPHLMFPNRSSRLPGSAGVRVQLLMSFRGSRRCGGISRASKTTGIGKLTGPGASCRDCSTIPVAPCQATTRLERRVGMNAVNGLQSATIHRVVTASAGLTNLVADRAAALLRRRRGPGSPAHSESVNRPWLTG
jgi:hypothetical protein